MRPFANDDAQQPHRHRDNPLPRAPANTFRFRVRATDTKGNTSAFVTGPTLTLGRQAGGPSAAITYVGTWTQSNSSTAYGGATKFATTATARATFSFTGRAVAWVAPMSSIRGVVDIYVDGLFVQSVDLFSATFKPRMTVFTRSWATSSAHTVQVRLNAASTLTRRDIDAFVFLK